MSFIQIYKSTKGQIFMCPRSKRIFIEFGNVNMKLSRKDFKAFRDYVFDIDVDAMEDLNRLTPHNRKIHMSIFSRKFVMSFSREEMYELRLMLKSVEPCLKIQKLGVESHCSSN